MIYGILLWFVIVFVTIFLKARAYVSDEAKEGVGRLIAVVVGSVVLVLAVILGFKFIIASL